MAMKIASMLHIKGIKKRFAWFCVNHVFKGTNPAFFTLKSKVLNLAGYSIGKGTKIVGPIECTGSFSIGDNCWIGKNMRINGNGNVKIGNNCDIAPEVTFQTGGHLIGSSDRRAGKGQVFDQVVEDGVWIGGRATILNNTTIGESSVIAACACVSHDVEPNVLVGGVPARIIRRLTDDT